MITELSAQNFKSWADTGKIQFAPLTGFFGANNSGKTSLLQTLLLFKQTVERPQGDLWEDFVEVDQGTQYPLNWIEPLYFGDNTSLVNLGDFDTVVHRHKEDLNLFFSLSWKLAQPRRIKGQTANTFSFSTSIVKKDGNSALERFRYTAGESAFDVKYVDGVYRHMGAAYTLITSRTLTPFRCYGVISPTEDHRIFSVLSEVFEKLFSQIRPLSPLRESPKDHYTWEGDYPEGVGQHGEHMVPALLAGRLRLLSIDEQIPKWLHKFGLIDSYELLPVTHEGGEYEFFVKEHPGGPDVRLTDVGFGVSQLLPVLISCYSAPENSILILEQPEAHLHPKVQSELADMLIDVVKNRNIQIILESHSEHLLLRLMRRIAEYGVEEEGISENQTAFYFCEINDGNSKAEQLKVDEYGNISNWPKDFFGDEMGDLAAKTKAEMQRRKANKK